MKFNPFQPGKIVSPSMFAGRLEELDSLEQSLFQAKNGNPSHFLIHGERGIGKSSLLLFLDFLANGKVTSHHNQQYSFITAQVELESGNSYVDIVQKVGCELARSLKRHEKLKSIIKDGLQFLSRWEVMGVKYDRASDERDRTPLFEDLCDSVIEASNRTKGACDGILLLLDECDKPPVEAHLGEFTKIFTERLTRQGAFNVLVGLSGVYTVVDKLRKSHESSLRVFHQFELKPLPVKEAGDIIQKGIQEANTRNTNQTTIDPAVVSWIADRGSQGYPHFIQEYAHAAFDADNDGKITMQDLHLGVYRENGALDQLGKKYFESMYLDQIKSDDYRNVLRIMSDHLDGYVTKAQLRSGTGLKEHTLNNALTALKQRNIIIPKKGVIGSYRLPSRSFAIWIKTFTAVKGVIQGLPQ